MKTSNLFLNLSFVSDVAVRNKFSEIKGIPEFERSWTDKIINIILFNPTLNESDQSIAATISNFGFVLIQMNTGSKSPETFAKLHQIVDIFKRVLKAGKTNDETIIEALNDHYKHNGGDLNETTYTVEKFFF